MKKITNLILTKENEEAIQAHAEAQGESINSFINRAICETMERDNSTSDDLITLKEAMTILNESPQAINRKYIKTGRLDSKYINDGTKDMLRVYRNQVEELKDELEKEIISPFGELYLEQDEYVKFLDTFNSPHIPRDPRRYMSRCKYGVTNLGRVINLTHNRVLTPQNAGHGHQQVRINNKHELVHVAVASQWIPNGKHKNIIHHIDNNRKNNNINNLVAVTSEEHGEAHTLLNAAKESNDWTAYNAFIDELKKDNAWKEDVRTIVDPDYDLKDKGIHVWFVTPEGYRNYKSGKKTFNDLVVDGDIRSECYYR